MKRYSLGSRGSAIRKKDGYIGDGENKEVVE